MLSRLLAFVIPRNRADFAQRPQLDLSPQFIEGYDAYWLRKPCSYDTDSPEAEEWCRGQEDAFSNDVW